MRLAVAAVAFVLLLFVVPASAKAEEFTGKVVGIADGDTITVMRAGGAVKVRLAEIDCPEKAQALGKRAKQFASERVFGKTVRVLVRDTDHYGRTVGEVLLPDGRSLNRDLVAAGLAWHYKKYSKSPDLAALERQAKSAGTGLWADAQPVPPWEFRRSGRWPKAGPAPPAGAIIGNSRSKIYHWPGCPSYLKVSPKNRALFANRKEAEVAGYRAARNCR